MKKLSVKILGCGPAWGVPSVCFGWGACDPENPKNRRSRSSIFLEYDHRLNLLIDTSPDLRTQLLDNNVSKIDAVLLTHEHSDHTRGLDDLCPISRFQKKPLPLYGSADTLRAIQRDWHYAFHSHNQHYLAFLESHAFSEEPFFVEGLKVQPFVQDHGFTKSWGFRIGAFAYSTDARGLSETAFSCLEGVETWVVDCLQREPHVTHSHLVQTLEWIKRVGAKKAVLTHLSPKLDYAQLKKELPHGIEPAYDGMLLDLRV